MQDTVNHNNIAARYHIDPEKISSREFMESLRYAGLIQQALLPSGQLLERLLAEYFILFMPKTVVSGDFYWIAEKKNRIYTVAADCTGHGVPGALMSILGISLLNDVVRSDCTGKANRILNMLRERVMETLHQTGEFDESKDGMDLSLCIFDRENSVLQFSGANNPLYIVRNETLIEVKPDKMPVGINAVTEEPFTNQIIQGEKGDVYYMFSDGFPDQFGGPRGKKFKYRPFKQLIVDIHSLKMEDQKCALKNTIHNWMGENEQVDDILIWGFRID